MVAISRVKKKKNLWNLDDDNDDDDIKADFQPILHATLR